MRLSITGPFATITLLLAAAQAVAQEPPPDLQAKAELMRQAEDSLNAAVTLSGRVEDEDGRPLERVRLNVLESRFDLEAESFSTLDTRDSIVDGWFSVACEKCRSVQLHFFKKGYHSEILSFSVETPELASRELEKAPDLERAHLRVVLRKLHNPVSLERYQATLRSAADGPVTVAPMRRGLGSRGVELERLREVALKSNEPMRYVRMLPAVSETGELAVKAAPERVGARMDQPAPAVLDFGEADGGIVLYRRSEEIPDDVYRAMTTAPEEGYESSIEIEPGPGSYYFYCRIGERYGKGMVVAPSFGHADDGREVTLAFVEIRLNPEAGDRNVETTR